MGRVIVDGAGPHIPKASSMEIVTGQMQMHKTFTCTQWYGRGCPKYWLEITTRVYK
jgi:hypothetical protein